MTTPSKEIIAKEFTPHRGGVNPIKSLGQNFLRNEAVSEELVGTSEPKQSDTYLEIGSGEGAITKILAPKVKKVIAVELDSKLAAGLKIHFAEQTNIVVVNQDIIKFLDAPRYYDMYYSNKIIGSIPYQITSPLIHRLASLISKQNVDSITLLIQKEVAGKITALPSKGSYLSNFVQTFFYAEFICIVPKGNFFPLPKVDGAIVKLEPRRSTVEPKKWADFLHLGFRHPRQIIKKVFGEATLSRVGINPRLRAGQLSLSQWQKIYSAIKSGPRINHDEYDHRND